MAGDVGCETMAKRRWHGFNSGVLAASRMYMDLSIAYKEEMAEDPDQLDFEYDGNVPPVSERLAARRRGAVGDFPMLDC